MRILLLHGNRQTYEVFKGRIGALVNKLRKQKHEVGGYDGPIKLELVEGDEACTSSWWNRGYDELPSILEKLKDYHDKKFAFDGIIGFSQGAKLAYLLAQHSHRSEVFPFLKFVVLASCYHGHHPAAGASLGINEATESDPLMIPSLHVIGELDKVVDPASSERVARTFADPKFHRHAGGHHLPMRSADLKVLVDFICSFDEPVLPPPPPAAAPLHPSQEAQDEQMDELTVLAEIFSDESEFLLEVRGT